ncbi:unnamed protein product (mitochondrion) [Plasmodiophora brassicae]|uniref:Enoyl reductase (ER) domain-containing protein n=1 Tax=Plasmodiophora brassicae TaxID=37360 RepID=A0A0G4J7L2_PLABS|nr:hypothetical protein PBRA_003114 [Plasmodiophora brassicae]SPQ95592.1 unnamed protein product [Plasmodiophora brassicae]
MKAYVRNAYGPAASSLQFKDDVPIPALQSNQVLVKVHAAALNAGDWHVLRGAPGLIRLALGGLTRPRPNSLFGSDFAGVVEQVGDAVKDFKVGDGVFGQAPMPVLGAFAEYVAVDAGAVALKPSRLSYEEAAAIPVAAATALVALTEQAKLANGQKVLINGASGGVGTFAVQIAKALGAEVTAVCSTKNVALVKSLGADHVIDYTQQNFTDLGNLYDAVIDIVSTQGVTKMLSCLTPTGVLVVVGTADQNESSLSFLAGMIGNQVRGLIRQRRIANFVFMPKREYLETLKGWVETMQVRPVIDKVFQFEDLVKGVEYLETGHVAGKAVVTIAK